MDVWIGRQPSQDGWPGSTADIRGSPAMLGECNRSTTFQFTGGRRSETGPTVDVYWYSGAKRADATR
jgi:hypothetical protein